MKFCKVTLICSANTHHPRIPMSPHGGDGRNEGFHRLIDALRGDILRRWREWLPIRASFATYPIGSGSLHRELHSHLCGEDDVISQRHRLITTQGISKFGIASQLIRFSCLHVNFTTPNFRSLFLSSFFPMSPVWNE